MTVDWSKWLQLTPAEQQAMRTSYLEKIARERDENARRWARMTPLEKARYPQ